MRIRFSKKFAKQYNKADTKIKSAFQKRLKIFLKNPFDPRLRNHLLVGNYEGLFSINITGDWRALYRKYKEGNETIVIFETLGTHSQLYK